MIKKIILATFFVLFVTGCRSTVSVYDNVHYFDSQKIKKHNKQGEVCNYRVLFYTTDPADYTISKAARSSGIKEVVFVEHSVLSVLDTTSLPIYDFFTLFKRSCLIVKGN
ncbi:MAG: hypothetical protein KGQ36_00170 [Rickettsiales bacterium]|nr:hypothetical protein [Rickettsiales bacterium]